MTSLQGQRAPEGLRRGPMGVWPGSSPRPAPRRSWDSSSRTSARPATSSGALLLFIFALGLGLLLMMLGIFSGLLTSLPKAGAWMERIKKGFGVAMLLIGAWFLFTAINLWIHTGGRA
jgi:hypothetical protein